MLCDDKVLIHIHENIFPIVTNHLYCCVMKNLYTCFDWRRGAKVISIEEVALYAVQCPLFLIRLNEYGFFITLKIITFKMRELIVGIVVLYCKMLPRTFDLNFPDRKIKVSFKYVFYCIFIHQMKC